MLLKISSTPRLMEVKTDVTRGDEVVCWKVLLNWRKILDATTVNTS